MQAFLIRRILQLIPTLFIVSVIVFLITRILPGNPAAVMLGPQASAEDIAAYSEKLGLNDPMYQQFFDYLVSLITLDFGNSLSYNQPIIDLILERFPNTIVLAISALIIATIIGVPAGIIAAKKQNTIVDYSVTTLSLIGVSMPIFWLGVMLVLYFSVNLGWLPATGMGSLENGFWDFLSHLILPSLALATIPTAQFARIIRSSMLETISQDYIKTARSKGLKESIVTYKHAFKNALTPLITVMGLQFSMLLGGAVLTETIFSWPGMGLLIIDAIEKRDFVVVQSTVIFIAVIYVVINLIVDILYKVVNPKVNLDSNNGGA
ncbi:peptide/nickel transport system permease protein [Lentibacillus persicus]|uniref:Peptide/nickel transport system permease protein n=1 Tax=Lentibacillus persicus TaxID=640948 RepID=A0A1I1W100_9BACI|nr:ABC transporter permease [Lentibacillus persicus]SFD88058.1 peptide/nickel transport system permease protein [Lentibacillus persicus]